MIDPAFVLLRKKQREHGDFFCVTKRQAKMLIDAGYATEMPGPAAASRRNQKNKVWVLVTPHGTR